MTIAVVDAPSTNTPVRGTQSFVGIMVDVWKRPSLTAIEVAWRWAFGIVAISLAAWRWGKSLEGSVQLFSSTSLGSLGVEALGPITRDLRMFEHTVRADIWLVVIGFAVWIALSAWGRGKVLRRYSGAGSSSYRALLVISALRVLSLLLVMVLWLGGVVRATTRMILSPEVLPADRPLVPYAAILIVGTLAMFVGWMAVSYMFQLAPVFAVEQGMGPFASLRAALRKGPLRGKVIEVNLVLGIVKIALLVLALVFSACPLPFSSVETQSFLVWWTAGVAVWYLLASDFFHVVRSAVCMRLWQVYEK